MKRAYFMLPHSPLELIESDSVSIDRKIMKIANLVCGNRFHTIILSSHILTSISFKVIESRLLAPR